MFNSIIRLRNNSGMEVIVRFQPITYFDWTTYGHPDDRMETSTIDYILDTYVTSITLGGNETNKHELDGILKSHIVNLVFSESDFENKDTLTKKISRYKEDALTLMGVYDLFIWQNMDIGTYITLLDSQSNIRTKIISYLELTMGIDVAKRFEFCIENKGEMDLRTPDNKYYRMMAKGKKPAQTNGQSSGDNIPNDKNRMIEEARRALEAETSRYMGNKDNKQRYYNWHNDVLDRREPDNSGDL